MDLGYKFIRVVPKPLEPGRKTCDYDVLNRSGGYPLAKIRWYGQWRQYCLFPSPGMVWSAGCLRDVLDAMGIIDRARKISSVAREPGEEG